MLQPGEHGPREPSGRNAASCGRFGIQPCAPVFKIIPLAERMARRSDAAGQLAANPGRVQPMKVVVEH
jgi:hypothetical protein